jgi:hypothetical protein
VAGPPPGTTFDHRQAPRGQERAPDPLHHPRGDEDLDRGGHRAQQRRHREQANADHEDTAPAVAIAQRSAEEDQRCQGELVAVENPLERACRGVQVAPDRGQRDVDHRPIEERHARSQDRDEEHPTPGAAAERDLVDSFA